MAVIFDIERCGLHDGPGIRTVVFFKGCPLRCRWCHNPESWDTAPQTLVYPEKCIACGGCADGCYTGARTICGQEMTVELWCTDNPGMASFQLILGLSAILVNAVRLAP